MDTVAMCSNRLGALAAVPVDPISSTRITSAWPPRPFSALPCAERARSGQPRGPRRGWRARRTNLSWAEKSSLVSSSSQLSSHRCLGSLPFAASVWSSGQSAIRGQRTRRRAILGGVVLLALSPSTGKSSNSSSSPRAVVAFCSTDFCSPALSSAAAGLESVDEAMACGDRAGGLGDSGLGAGCCRACRAREWRRGEGGSGGTIGRLCVVGRRLGGR